MHTMAFLFPQNLRGMVPRILVWARESGGSKPSRGNSSFPNQIQPEQVFLFYFILQIKLLIQFEEIVQDLRIVCENH